MDCASCGEPMRAVLRRGTAEVFGWVCDRCKGRWAMHYGGQR